MRFIKGEIELRKHGSIGEFTTHKCKTQADSLEQAVTYLIDDAHAYGYEPRSIFYLRPCTVEVYRAMSCPWMEGEEVQ